MAKSTTLFYCKECGGESIKWMGQCPHCKEWNTLTKALTAKESGGKVTSVKPVFQSPEHINNLSVKDEHRITTGMAEMDRVLGGGIVTGSLILVGGDPGIGKSTLLLQLCRNVSEKGKKVLYISGEESMIQIKLRAERIGDFKGDLMLLTETNLNFIEQSIEQTEAKIVVIDSIQTMYHDMLEAAPGSISQVREVTGSLLRLAKSKGITVFIVGHVTKEGNVAGPKMLEHMVDTVLYFEGDNSAAYRLLRSAKNRFGSTNEVGVFEMKGSGLSEVPNPSEYMMQGKPENESGSVVACTVEGTRPFMIEVQALVCRSNFNLPRRTAAGMDYNRVNLLMAVIEKRLGIRLSDCDAYVNVAGGMRINEPALDLAIVAAILSSHRGKIMDERTVLFGEVGLVGEVRGISQAELRVREAKKLGYTTCILPYANIKSIGIKEIEMIGIKNIRELLNFM
ncbi:MAG: DNA repair protein RadA [Lachnoclostridium sp.]|nr:DNA repair protein RadA [Lachnoclostridium sp.]